MTAKKGTWSWMLNFQSRVTSLLPACLVSKTSVIVLSQCCRPGFLKMAVTISSTPCPVTLLHVTSIATRRAFVTFLTNGVWQK